MANSSARIRARYANDHHDLERIAIGLMPAAPQIPIASQAASRRFAGRVGLLYGTVFGLIGTHTPFFPVWLRAIGIDASWIGIISAVPAVTRFTILPFITALAERRHALRGAIVLTAFATAVGFALTGSQRLPLAVFLAYIATCASWTPLLPLTEAYALRGVVRYGLKYGPLRLWGSAAFVMGALVCGWLADVIAADRLIWIIVAVAALGTLASLGLQHLDRPASGTGAVQGDAKLLRDRGFLAVIIAGSLIQGSHAAYYAFSSINWQAHGLGGLTIAGLWGLGVLAEIVVFALSPRFILQPTSLMAIGACSAIGRWLIMAQEPQLALLAPVQLAHGLTYGLTQVGTMGLLVRLVPDHVTARGQGYFAACNGITASVASILSGAVYARYGQGVYYVMAGMGASGAILILLMRRRLKHHPHNSASGG
jgi:MFS transporter, PPP family, 3-phenylpropionic acid transporter